MLTSALLCVWKGGSDASRFDVGVALFACYSKRKKKKERNVFISYRVAFFGRFGAAKAKSEIGRAAQHDAISKVRQRSPPKGGNENKKKGPKRKSFGGWVGGWVVGGRDAPPPPPVSRDKCHVTEPRPPALPAFESVK